MTAPELRSFVRGVADGLEDDQRAVIVDSLVTRAARGDAGWKPSRPSRRIVDEVRLFVEAARRIGHPTDRDVSEHPRSPGYFARDRDSRQISGTIAGTISVPQLVVDRMLTGSVRWPRG